MNTLNYLQAAVLLASCLGAAVAAADPSGAPRSAVATPGEAKLPQVIIIGKRLSAAEKAKMAQQESAQENRKVLSRRAPRKAIKNTHNVS